MRSSREYSFSTFRVKLICVTSEGTQTALLIYEKSDGSRPKPVNTPPAKVVKKQPKSKTVRSNSDGSDIYYTESRADVQGMEVVGEFSASSPLKRVYIDAFRAAMRKIHKRLHEEGTKAML